MAHIREELRLRLIGLFRLFLGAPELLFGLLPLGDFRL
jgi:hypothetical protein